MASTKHKSHVGKEDIEIQINMDDAETFTRQTSTGESITMTKVPDIWDGTGKVNTGRVLIRALDDNDTVLHCFGDDS